MSKKEIFWENEYQYDLEVLENIHTLYYANVESWQSNVRNTIALQLINTGNDFKVVGLNNKNRLNYSEAVHMYIILAAEKDYKVEIVESKREL